MCISQFGRQINNSYKHSVKSKLQQVRNPKNKSKTLKYKLLFLFCNICIVTCRFLISFLCLFSLLACARFYGAQQVFDKKQIDKTKYNSIGTYQKLDEMIHCSFFDQNYDLIIIKFQLIYLMEKVDHVNNSLSKLIKQTKLYYIPLIFLFIVGKYKKQMIRSTSQNILLQKEK